MLCRFICTLLTTALISEKIIVNGQIRERPKRNLDENFNILLNLYKVKPMKYSNVFKTFSDSMLLPNRSDRNVLTFNSKEYIYTDKSENNNTALKYLEEQIHVSRNPVTTRNLETIEPPNYKTPLKFETKFPYRLFMDLVSSTEAKNIEEEQNIQTKKKTEDKSYRSNVKTYFVPDTTYNRNNNDNEFFDGQWEAHLENGKQKHYNSNKNEKQNKFNITTTIPVNFTVSTDKQDLHFYDDPINRIEEISKDDDSVLVIR
ncbi:uncharacterized protein LOC113232561 [Hyposmocoma kahamanoa]|uniref:uncharacterized protein LOC113232561 n=1 Tax=Hyposmocoma kahamanoa TaxID=1477025 RepID=UPI000E6D96BA|nr:uncharacterized protein LOC113232561 [Hyposmocoma kahamanoa]